MGCVSSATEKEARTSADAPTNTSAIASTTSDKKKPPPGAEMSVLLLGQGESGKSTIFKQMKIIQAREEGTSEFSNEERLALRFLIWNNVISQMRVLVCVAKDEAMEFSSPEAAQWATQLAGDTGQLEAGSPQAAMMEERLFSE